MSNILQNRIQNLKTTHWPQNATEVINKTTGDSAILYELFKIYIIDVDMGAVFFFLTPTKMCNVMRDNESSWNLA